MSHFDSALFGMEKLFTIPNVVNSSFQKYMLFLHISSWMIPKKYKSKFFHLFGFSNCSS